MQRGERGSLMCEYMCMHVCMETVKCTHTHTDTVSWPVINLSSYYTVSP